jgi:hypothetical protein
MPFIRWLLILLRAQSAADLAWEIAVLEEQVVRKELHLLSLYRAAFDQYLGVSPRASAQVRNHNHPSPLQTGAHQCPEVSHAAL